VSAQNEWQIDTCPDCYQGEEGDELPPGKHRPGHDGGVYTTGVGGALTGRAVDLLIIDDPVKDRLQAESELYRERSWDWWTDVASTRLAPGAPVALILTRWHHDDLAGRLRKAEDGHLWKVINIPAVADHRPEKGETDLLDREPGEFMVSARGRTRKQWEAIKVRVGSRTWTSLYQGRPTPDTGNLFPSDRWARYTQPLWIPRGDGARIIPGLDSEREELVQSWDFTFKDTKGTDYVVGQVWLRRGTQAYLLDMVRRRMSFTESCRAMLDMTARWPQAIAKLVEDKANGPAIINSLGSKVGGIIPVEPEGSKYARAVAVSPFVEARNVLLPDPNEVEGTAWVTDLTDEARDFPQGKHDDTVDALSQAVHRLLLVPILSGQTFDEHDLLPDLEDDLDWTTTY
jgi:predicted phage terminase large subunit-like protein